MIGFFHTMGMILILDSSMCGRSAGESSVLSEYNPRPSERDLAGDIQMYGWGAYSILLVRTNSLSDSERHSYIVYPLTKAVVPRGTSSSSSVSS